MTPEERAARVGIARGDDALACEVITRANIADAICEAIADEREACAKIVLAGGDGVDRLETAIAHGTNAAIAAAIMARGTT